jgi:heme-degrading monooxygenase HmoA
MFVAIYRMRIRPGHETRYAADWKAVTQIALDRFGSGGSALFRDKDGIWTAIARWRTREDRQAFFDRPDRDPEMDARMRDAVLESFPAQELEVIEDLWAAFPVSPA